MLFCADVSKGRILSSYLKFALLIVFLSSMRCYTSGGMVHRWEVVCNPTLAKIFLSFLEQNWIDQYPTEFKLVFYRRYVDDTFILFKSIDKAPLFLDLLNRQHPSIKFTAELKKKNSISFLDIKVSSTEQSFDMGVFRKGTFIGLGMMFDSVVSNKYK